MATLLERRAGIILSHYRRGSSGPRENAQNYFCQEGHLAAWQLTLAARASGCTSRRKPAQVPKLARVGAALTFGDDNRSRGQDIEIPIKNCIARVQLERRRQLIHSYPHPRSPELPQCDLIDLLSGCG